MSTRIRVLLVDDHPVVRRGILACLAGCEHIAVVGEAADGMEGLSRAREQRPDVVLTDLDMPHMNGLVLAEALRRELPDTRVLVLSMHNDTEQVLRVIQSGARGFVLKESQPAELIQAIEAVARGNVFFSPDVARAAMNQVPRGSVPTTSIPKLTPREREVLVGIAEGLSNREIAERLSLGVRTVETHRENLMAKLNIHSIAGLTRFAVANGLVAIDAGF
jgi:two-component system, NarL family, nitrate/nitrite response regulator NarL